MTVVQLIGKHDQFFKEQRIIRSHTHKKEQIFKNKESAT